MPIVSNFPGGGGGKSFIVTITGNDTNGYTANRTAKEIDEAYNAGKICLVTFRGYIYQYRYKLSDDHYFFLVRSMVSKINDQYRCLLCDTFRISSTDILRYQNEFPDAKDGIMDTLHIDRNLYLVADPTEDLEAATKQYVDSKAKIDYADGITLL